jgi:ectoine hydroxylase-related dioxygenase (phytanoyl-CoA dioxygenase family)
MWAVTNFTAANGGTLLVPGSHTWSADRRPEPGEVISAEMPAGSVLFWLGGTLHGGGANVSQDWRYGVILTYSLGWLRQEENQSLAVPPELAGRLAPGLRDMIGGTMNGSLGFHFYKEIGADPEGGGDNLVQLNS